jgi:hypothetical protein
MQNILRVFNLELEHKVMETYALAAIYSYKEFICPETKLLGSKLLAYH